MSDPRRENGLRIRREVLGDAHVDRAIARTTPFTEPFQDFITRTAWGDIWARPGLDRRTRSAITLALLVALRAEGEIGMHVRAALRNGLTRDEIAEVLLHATVYSGVPAGNAAFAIAQEALAAIPADADAAAGAAADRADRDAKPAAGVDPAAEPDRAAGVDPAAGAALHGAATHPFDHRSEPEPGTPSFPSSQEEGQP